MTFNTLLLDAFSAPFGSVHPSSVWLNVRTLFDLKFFFSFSVSLDLDVLCRRCCEGSKAGHCAGLPEEYGSYFFSAPPPNRVRTNDVVTPYPVS